MKQYVRDGLLERVEREGATVGASIPETLTIGSETVALRSFVHETSNGERDPDAVQEVVVGLREERRRRREEIKTGDITRERAEQLADSILGIDRALTVLESSGETDLEAEAERKRLADRKRWLSFLDSVTGDGSNTIREGRQ